MPTEQENARLGVKTLDRLLAWCERHPQVWHLSEEEKDAETKGFMMEYSLHNQVLMQSVVKGRRALFGFPPVFTHIVEILALDPDPDLLGGVLRRALSSALLAFTTSGPTYPVLETEYREFIDVLGTRLPTVPAVLTTQNVLILANIAEDLADAGLTDESRRLATLVELVSSLNAGRDPKDTIPGGAPAGTSARDLFALLSDEVCRDGVVEHWESDILKKIAPILGLDLQEAIAIGKASAEKFRAGTLGTQRPLEPLMAYQKILLISGAIDQMTPFLESRLTDVRGVLRISDAAHQFLVQAMKHRFARRPPADVDDGVLEPPEVVALMASLLEADAAFTQAIAAGSCSVEVQAQARHTLERILTCCDTFPDAALSAIGTARGPLGVLLAGENAEAALSFLRALDARYAVGAVAAETLQSFVKSSPLSAATGPGPALLLAMATAPATSDPGLWWKLLGTALEEATLQRITHERWEEALQAVAELETRVAVGGKHLAASVALAAGTLTMHATAHHRTDIAQEAFRLIDRLGDFLDHQTVRNCWGLAAGCLAAAGIWNNAPSSHWADLIDRFTLLNRTYLNDERLAATVTDLAAPALFCCLEQGDRQGVSGALILMKQIVATLPHREDVLTSLAETLARAILSMTESPAPAGDVLDDLARTIDGVAGGPGSLNHMVGLLAAWREQHPCEAVLEACRRVAAATGTPFGPQE